MKKTVRPFSCFCENIICFLNDLHLNYRTLVTYSIVLKVIKKTKDKLNEINSGKNYKKENVRKNFKAIFIFSRKY